jgi:hypothetical protein
MLFAADVSLLLTSKKLKAPTPGAAGQTADHGNAPA